MLLWRLLGRLRSTAVPQLTVRLALLCFLPEDLVVIAKIVRGKVTIAEIHWSCAGGGTLAGSLALL